MVHRYMRDNGHELTIYVNFMVKCVCYIDLGSNSCFVIVTTLTNDHYKTYIISGVGHLRLNSIMPLVLWMVEYNVQGTDIVLQVP
jgi:hypothetical protein